MIGILSLFLELLFNQIIPKSSYFLPLFTLVSLLFIKRNNKYYIYLFILGFIYDLFFTEVIFLHSIIFLFLGFIIKLFKRNLLVLLLVITIYQVLLSISYILINNININFNEFIFIIKHYYIINIIYYLILSIIYKKKS